MYAIKEVAVLDLLLRASRVPGFTALFFVECRMQDCMWVQFSNCGSF